MTTSLEHLQDTTRDHHPNHGEELLAIMQQDELFTLVTSWRNLFTVLSRGDYGKANKAWQNMTMAGDITFSMKLIGRVLDTTPEEDQTNAMRSIQRARHFNYTTVFESVDMSYHDVLKNLDFVLAADRLETFPTTVAAGLLMDVIEQSPVLKSLLTNEFKEFMEYVATVGTEKMAENIHSLSIW